MASGSIGSAVLDEGGSGSTHGSSLQFWHFPVYGENAYVLEGRHGGLLGTKVLLEELGKISSHVKFSLISPTIRRRIIIAYHNTNCNKVNFK